MKGIFTIVFSLISCFSFAFHLRSGEITYKCLGGYTYEITLTTYTKSSPTDRCFIELNFGDDTIKYLVCRCNYEPGDPATDPWGAICPANPNCSTNHMGEWNMFTLCLDIKKNVYCTTHTYPGPGTYIISFLAFNRINNILNIPSSNTSFYIADTLVINPFIAPCNSSPVFINPSLDTAHVGICHTYNSLAIDPDGDSLSYKLIPCMDAFGPIAGYSIPAGISLDSITGDLTWCSPPPPGIPPYPNLWNFAILITEWRNVGTNYIQIGTVMRDVQILVEACAGMAADETNVDFSAILLYPNPASDFAYLDAINMKNKSYDVAVYDFTGKVVLKKESISSETHLLSLSELQNGIYLVQIKTNSEIIASKKLQVQR